MSRAGMCILQFLILETCLFSSRHVIDLFKNRPVSYIFNFQIAILHFVGFTKTKFVFQGSHYHFSVLKYRVGIFLVHFHISQELGQCSRYDDWLQAGQPRDWSSSPGRVKNFFFFTLSRPAMVPTHPPIQLVPVPRSRKSVDLYLHSLIWLMV
jgi:hypothetical protein